MQFLLIPLIASFILLIGSSVLLATVGRRRHRRDKAIELRAIRAIEGVVGTSLAELAAGAIRLRRMLEDTAASGTEMLAVERHLGGHHRRPLWRQIEDANFGHELDRIRRAAAAWLASFDALDAAEREVFELLGLGPVHELLEAERFHWRDEGPPFERIGDRSDALAAVQQRLRAAIDCLRQVERELTNYRPRGYR